ncbi:MAG TPA: PRC-barrel domain-containing protein [Stellaceae bacterium]|nr:PRC-barrel domain-containing protein [Stellaceae bacterium]
MRGYKAALTAAALVAMAAGPALAQGAPQTISAVDIKTVASGFRASKVIGSTVVDGARESIGKIDDLIVANQPDTVYAVLSVGGFLGMDSKLVAVRYDQLRADPQHEEFVLNGATKESLKSLPQFEYASK